MKKRLIVVVLALSIVCLSGCTKVMDLSDNENRAIAEYSAELLLKHATGYESKYFEAEAASAKGSDTQAPTDTQTPAEPSTEPDNNIPGDSDSSVVPDATPAEYVTDIASILGLSNVSILFNNYQITDQYPSKDGNGSVVYLDAPEGMKLLVMEFNVSNLTGEPVDLNLLQMDVDYRVVLNQSKQAKPMLTILTEDLSTYMATLAPDSSSNAVLVFQISDSLVDQIQSLDIKVSFGDMEKMIKVL